MRSSDGLRVMKTGVLLLYASTHSQFNKWVVYSLSEHFVAFFLLLSCGISDLPPVAFIVTFSS